MAKLCFIYLLFTNCLSPVLFSEVMNYEFDRKDLACLAVSAIVGVWYLWKKVQHSTLCASSESRTPIVLSPHLGGEGVGREEYWVVQ